MALVLVFFLLACTEKTTPQASTLLSKIKQNYGVSVEKLVTMDQLPQSIIYKIQHKEIIIQYIPPTTTQFDRYVTLVNRALAKYPPALIRKHLKQIRVGGEYLEDGGIITGMYDRDRLFLFYNDKNGDNSDLYLEQTIHHEFSSILIKDYNFPAFDWLKLNPSDFRYIIKPSEINAYMNSVESYNASEAQLKQGLVSCYGKANAENDINSYAELIFTKPETMKEYIRKYPRISRKYEMIKQFYLSISPRFNIVFNSVK